MSVRYTYHRVVKFLITDIWNLDISELDFMRARMVRYLKVIILTIRNFSNDKVAMQATSLSFFSVLAVVPFTSLVFAITDGFGLGDNLESLLYTFFEGNEQVVGLILRFAGNVITTSQNGLFGLISVIFLLSTIISLMISVEKAFNGIWKVSANRLFKRRVLYYFSLMIISPFVILIFLSLGLFYSNMLEAVNIDKYFPISSLFIWLLAYAIIVLTFTIMYKYIPNIKVRLSAAFNSAIVIAVVFVAVQYLYTGTQLLVTGLNAVYGVFAAVPLFLVWMSVSWTLILFGAELSHAYQMLMNIKKPEKNDENGID